MSAITRRNKPIIFSAPMTKALLAGRETMTMGRKPVGRRTEGGGVSRHEHMERVNGES